MKLTVWLANSNTRQFPNAPIPPAKRSLEIPVARGERVSFQACFNLSNTEPGAVTATVRAPRGIATQIRRVGCVPVPHHNAFTPRAELDGLGQIPGYVPDILFPENKTIAAPGENNSFWITVTIPRSVAPGARTVTIELHAEGGRRETLAAVIDVSKIVLATRRKIKMTHWFYADSLCDYYGVEPFTPQFWKLFEAYIANYAAHGNDTLYVPVFTPPLDGIKRPTQLLGVCRKGGRYRFNWRNVKKWIALAKKAGIENFEWTHLFTQWGCRNALRIYEKRGTRDALLWSSATGATSKTYRDFLGQFLPELEKFLRRTGLLDRSYFHVSDEPHGDEHLKQYRKARAMLGELAPWMRVMDALSDIRYAREGITDIPVPSIRVAKSFADEGLPSWVYFCCNPKGRFLNRFHDTPLAKIRAAGWLFYRFGFGGFLHWGYNYWYRQFGKGLIDPYTISDGAGWPGWAYGDTTLVYPGPDGPLDSIRHEVFFESMQDCHLLETLGIDRTSKTLAAFRDFENFPKDGAWIGKMRRKLLFPK